MSRSDVLVDADWAEAHLDDPGVVFVEVDEDVSAYDGGHVKNAVRLDWTTELQQPDVRDLIDRDAFSELMSAKGISNDDTVVLYGGNNNWFAAYAYWQFKLYGHADVKLLDGGRKKWELDGRELVKDVPERPRTSYVAKDADLSIREFSGKIKAPAHLPQEQSQRAGHVPTAINIPWSKAAADDGTFKSDDELAKLYGEQGFDDGRSTIAYCRIGERSSHTWFVLHELLGKTDVKNYDGSWAEYGSLVGVPVQKDV